MRITTTTATIALLLIVISSIFLTTTINANTKVQWGCTIDDPKTTWKHNVSNGVVPVYHTGSFTCMQSAPFTFTNSHHDLQEEVRIVCSKSGVKVSLIESCYASKPDSAFAAMRLDDGKDIYNIVLSCRH